MNILLLEPSDLLHFRDGRPMSGSLAGHGAAWPLPSVTNAALHAALWRADLKDVHTHRRGRSADYTDQRDRRFGSLVTAGPFPVLDDNTWLFPRPLDAGLSPAETDDTRPTFHPLLSAGPREDSSLPRPLAYPVANSGEPTKKKAATWWNAAAWHAYLREQPPSPAARFLSDSAFCDTEHAFGIGIDPATGTQDGERFYSAHYLRLKPGCRLGQFAEAMDKEPGSPHQRRDLVAAVFPHSGSRTPVVVGGQQRLCTVERRSGGPLPLPLAPEIKGTRVKWILLSPAIFPHIPSGWSKRGTERQEHPGGWLPTWICPASGQVLLETITPEKRLERRRLNANGQGYRSLPDIDARLVAALVGKPLPVTGYALPHETTGDPGGAKPTQLAVPAGSVYYFEATSETEARKLADALNWHGADTEGTTIRNRRSTLLGEKGFGLGVCGAWTPHPAT